jgi:hypothetical protein
MVLKKTRSPGRSSSLLISFADLLISLNCAAGSSRQAFAEDMADKTGAIKAGFGRTAAAPIADTEQIHGLVDRILRRGRGTVDERYGRRTAEPRWVRRRVPRMRISACEQKTLTI